MVGSLNDFVLFYFRFFALDFIGLIMQHQKEGTKHFIQQRITAILNIILGVIVFNFFINNINKSHDLVLEGLSNDLMWLIVILFTLSMSFHMWIGLNHILDDYVAVSYTHLRAHETTLHLVCRLLLEKKKHNKTDTHSCL